MLGLYGQHQLVVQGEGGEGFDSKPQEKNTGLISPFYFSDAKLLTGTEQHGATQASTSMCKPKDNLPGGGVSR